MMSWHHGVSVYEKQKAFGMKPTMEMPHPGMIQAETGGSPMALLDDSPTALPPGEKQEVLQAPIMSPEMQKKAEAAASELVNRMEMNIPAWEAMDMQSRATVSIAISLRRIADNLDVIANAR
jgi:hypothetical protein